MMNDMYDVNRDLELQGIMQAWQNQNYPGSRPGGSGLTGLSPGDARGWSKMQNKNLWALNAMREQEGQSPLSVRRGQDFGNELDYAPPPGFTNEAAMQGLQSFQAGGAAPSYLTGNGPMLPSSQRWAVGALRGLQRGGQ